VNVSIVSDGRDSSRNLPSPRHSAIHPLSFGSGQGPIFNKARD
jgi:hypothetical protein